MTAADVHGDLAGLVAGTVAGRRDDAEVFVFDSTGVALEDAAAAAIVYERARAAGRGTRVRLGT
jgi:alanine dehydrogenase